MKYFNCRISRNDLASVRDKLLTNLFNALKLPGSQENEYVMKGKWRKKKKKHMW